MHRSTALVICAVSLAACAQVPTDGMPPSVAPIAAPDGKFMLVRLNGRAVPSGTTIEFRDGNAVSGDAPCNRYFGSFRAGPGAALALSELGSTQAACPALQLESDYLTALRSATGFRQDAGGQSLALMDAGGRTVASYARPAPATASLDGD